MNLLKSLLAVVFLFPLLLKAQSHYKPGYVVTTKGDTLHGFIDYRGWDSNPTSVSFKPSSENQKVRTFKINDISFFEIDGIETYKKYICNISMDETNPAHLNSGRDTSYRVDTVFLKILQKGKNVALYSYTDGLKTRFYIGEAPDYDPRELIYRLYDDTGIADNKAGNTVIESTYLKQLFSLAIKYNALDNGLSKVFETGNYSSPYLIEVISKINRIPKAEFEKKYSAKTKFNFFVSGALNISNTSSSDGSLYATDGGVPHTSYLPALSFGLNIAPNSVTDKVELRMEFQFAQTKFNALYDLRVSPNIPFKASYSQSSFSLLPQIIFNLYNTENFKVYLGGGADFTHFSFGKSYFGSQNPNVSDNGIGQAEPYYFANTDDSFILKAGVKFKKKWEVYLNYLTSTAITGGGYFELNNGGEQIGLLYFFGK